MKTSMMVRAGAGMLLVAAAASADTKIVSKYTAEGQTSNITVLTNGSRQRYEYGKDSAVIQQCDTGQMIELNLQNHTFVRAALPAGAAASVDTAGATDTGERKPFFGRTARHLKSMKTDASGQRTEVDGWYVDLTDATSCGGSKAAPYPAAYTMKTFGPSGKPQGTVTMEVMQLDTTTLSSGTFDVPAGYSEQKPETASARKGGTPRVAVALMNNHARYVGDLGGLDARLLSDLRQQNVDVVAVKAADESIRSTAQQLECDYILYTDIAEVATGAGQPAKKAGFGGLMKKASSLAGVHEGVNVRLDYRLEPAAGGEPITQASATGKNGGGFTLRNAIQLASTATMFMGPAMFANPSMMKAFSGGGMMSGMMVDPTMNVMMRVAQTGSEAAAAMPEPQGDAAKALAMAIEQESKGIAEALAKTK